MEVTKLKNLNNLKDIVDKIVELIKSSDIKEYQFSINNVAENPENLITLIKSFVESYSANNSRSNSGSSIIFILC